MRFVIAGVGNVLRGDDGFGVEVARRLHERTLPDDVFVMDIGIGGIHLVQELLRERVDHLVVVDSLDLRRPAGTVVVTRPEVPDVTTAAPAERDDRLADMHYATPERAFMLARALSVLPDSVWVVGCQPERVDRVGPGLSLEVARAVEPAIGEIARLVRAAGIEWN